MAPFHVFVINGKSRKGGDGLKMGMGRMLSEGRGSYAERSQTDDVGRKTERDPKHGHASRKEREKRAGLIIREGQPKWVLPQGTSELGASQFSSSELYLCVITHTSLVSMVRASLNDMD